MPDLSQAQSETLTRMSELFGAHKAEWLGPRLFELFSAPDYFPEMTTSRPCILVGGRGTGKTTVLRGLSYQGQFEIEKRDSQRVHSWLYYGFYSRVDTNRVGAFKGPELSEFQWRRRFAHYMNLLMCVQALRFLSWFHETTGNTTDLDQIELERIASAFSLPSPGDNDDLLSSLERSLTKFEAHINNVADDPGPSLSLQGAPVDVLFEAIKRQKVFTKKLFFFLIDEYENLEDYQQRLVNTLIKHSGELYSFKICVRELGWRVRNTIAESEVLVSPADYIKIDITDVMQGSKFEEFSHKVCQDRLAALVKERDNDVADIRDLLPSLSEDDEATLLGIEDHNQPILDSLREFAPPDIIDRMTPMELCLLGYWSDSHNQPLNEVFAHYRQNRTAWQTRLDNYGHSLLFTIRRGRRGIRKYYAGWNTFIKLSGGNIRFLLQLVEAGLSRHLREGNELNQALSPEMQTIAAQLTGRANLTELEGISVHGAQLTKLLLSLGRVFGLMASSPEGHTPEVTQFRVVGTWATETQEHDTNTLLTAAVMHLALARRSGSKLMSKGDIRDWEYMIYPIYVPFFNFSYRRKRKMHLKPAQVLALVDEPSRGIREILANTERSDDEPLPEQLQLFELFYADSS